MSQTSQVPAFRTLVLGATMAGGFVALTAQSHAMMTADEFLASMSQMKRICHTLEEPFIIKRYNYGCGKYQCKDGRCYTAKIKRKRRRPPPVLTHVPANTVLQIVESKGGKDGDNNDGGNDGRGNGPNGSGPNGRR